MWRVIGCQGCGSAIVEAALALAEIPYEREEVDYTEPGPAFERLRALNPLGQVPAVILPDGEVMTETAAIVLYLDEQHPERGLLPPRGTPERRHALRWLVFLVAAVYPTFTYGDQPEKWVGNAGPKLRDATHAHRQVLWRQLDAEVRGPWFTGAQFSLLDVYISAMTRWRPRRAWFAEHAPKLHAIAEQVDRDPRLAAVWALNFP